MEIAAIVKTVIYRKEENFWSVLEAKSSDGLIKITGITEAREGQSILAEGQWGVDRNNKKQFEATRISIGRPESEEGIAQYLSSGVIPGIGPGMAEKIVSKFGVDVFRVLDESPQKLLSVKGLSQKLLTRILQGWRSIKNIEQITEFLSSRGLPISLANPINQEFGSGAMAMLAKNPYAMTTKISGVGFKSADKIALSEGIEKNSPFRIQAGVMYQLNQAISNGSCGIGLDELVTNLDSELGVSATEVHEAVKALLNEERPQIELDDMVVWSKQLYDAEENIASLLLSKLNNMKPLLSPEKTEEFIVEVEGELGFELATEQKEAIRLAIKYGILVLIGGPGCGKTFTTDSVLSIFKRLNKSIVLTAPTGKAAQRATEATGIQAETMHRLMNVEDENSTPQAIDADLATIDESSMADSPIFNHFCNAVSLHTRIFIVGDFNQLLSVGPGNVLKDIVLSGAIPVVVLTKVFRQAEGSLIIQNAHNINKGLPLKNGRNADDDFWIITENNYSKFRQAKQNNADLFAESVAEMVCYLVCERIPEKRGINADDIWVLTPTNKGPCGVDSLNKRLQESINPTPPDYVEYGSTKFGVHDRVMQVQNNYDLNIFNGDIGHVKYVNKDDGLLEVQFEGRDELTAIPFEDLGALRLGYAMTIHRSQGSQARAIVIPLLMQHYMLLQRNVIYTGITRAKELAVMVGESEAIKLSAQRTDNTVRTTRLKQLLLDGAT